MGSALSSTTTSSRDTPSTSSSSNSESSTDFRHLDSSPIPPNPSMSDFDSKTLDSKSKIPETDSQENSVSTKPVDSSIGGNGDKQERLDLSEMEVSYSKNADEGEEEGEEGECGFCLFMKAGGCKESFIAWEQCIEEAEKTKEDIVEKCSDVTGALKKCMEAHADYYEPILRAEKMVEEEAVKELEMEKEKKKKEKEASTEGSYQYVVSDSKVSERGGASQ